MPEITPTPAGTVSHTGRRPDLLDSTPTPAGTVPQDTAQTYLRVPQPQQELSHRTQPRPTESTPTPAGTVTQDADQTYLRAEGKAYEVAGERDAAQQHQGATTFAEELWELVQEGGVHCRHRGDLKPCNTVTGYPLVVTRV